MKKLILLTTLFFPLPAFAQQFYYQNQNAIAQQQLMMQQVQQMQQQQQQQQQLQQMQQQTDIMQQQLDLQRGYKQPCNFCTSSPWGDSQ